MTADHERDLPELETPRLRARPLRDSDAPELFAIFSAPEVTRYWSSPPMHSPDQARERIADIRSDFGAGTVHEWGIELRALERLGFRVEGHLRDRWQATGEVQDSLILGLLQPEWRKR